MPILERVFVFFELHKNFERPEKNSTSTQAGSITPTSEFYDSDYLPKMIYTKNQICLHYELKGVRINEIR